MSQVSLHSAVDDVVKTASTICRTVHTLHCTVYPYLILDLKKIHLWIGGRSTPVSPLATPMFKPIMQVNVCTAVLWLSTDIVSALLGCCVLSATQ